MPSFLPLKRKSDADTTAPNKRIAGDSPEHYWVVQWRNYQARKHKTWDGDGILVVSGFKSTLHDSDGKVISTGKRDSQPYEQGRNLTVGGKELELDRSITREEFLSGECFGNSTVSIPVASSSAISKSTASKPFVPMKPRSHPQTKAVPLQPVDLLSTVNNQQPKVTVNLQGGDASYWTANWRKPQQKTWAGDCFVSNVGGKMSMMTEEGKVLGTTPWKGDILYPGYKLYIGGKEVQLDAQVTRDDLPYTIGGSENTEGLDVPKQPIAVATSESSLAISSKPFVAPTSFYGPAISKPKPVKPLHDPTLEGAVVMKSPNKEQNKKNLPVVDVVLDPILSSRMRPHQIEGVKFMYDCVMGLRKHEGQGCILADEMGLGKTLQTISLIWTLLKQNPYAGGGPVVGKVLVVCPVTLINNWKAEFIKWLGRDRLGVVAVNEKDKNAVRTFLNAKNQQVLIVGYERLRTVIDQLAYCMPPIGLIVCDEGHRLKSANSKTTTMFDALRTPRRILLSGTPIQNDLGEFHAMADFCNPGLLDDYQTFKRVYESAILKGRAPDSSAKERELGEARLRKLNSVTKSFVLRREAALLLQYLPPKHEYVVFVKPTQLQLGIFTKILNPSKLDDLVQSSTAESLALISILTKVSNSPILLKATADKHKATDNAGSAIKHSGVHEALKLLPEDAQVEDMSLSGKLTALAKLLKSIHQMTEEKCVLVSHYTSTLNILEAFCQKKSYSYYRVDGQTPTSKRQEYVNAFNKSNQRGGFIFLLSSKAGGVGINLIGGSRLCLIDSDWNPSHDEQSMARCHRDGQKRPVHIYRFLTAGAIDEKIFQRQVTKQGLRESLIGTATSTASSKSDSFTRKDLRDIFRVHPDTACNTHDLLACTCDGGDHLDTEESIPDDRSSDSHGEDSDVDRRGFVNASQVRPSDIAKMDKAYLRKKQQELASLSQWKHINCLLPGARQEIKDEMLRNLVFVPEARAPAKHHQSQLLAALEAAAASTVAAGDLPGGSASFIFQKSSLEETNSPTES
ncbi:SNF2 family N-terminal domain-containing protein [Mycena amicta]|nr:SNF2 family N-terminal domain-containing protein [Mycena amicta]